MISQSPLQTCQSPLQLAQSPLYAALCSRFSYRLYYHTDLHRHIDAAAGITVHGIQTCAKVGGIINPALELAVSRLGIQRREITLGQLCAAVSTDGKCFRFHRIHFLVHLIGFTTIKILNINGKT